MQNLEFKVLYQDLQKASTIAEQRGAQFQWTRLQVDTYFNCKIGKLKLRQVEDQPAELIAYQREQEKSARPSDYFIFVTDQPENLLVVLTKAFGVDRIVRKYRTLYLEKNVRIHLDRVELLGSFLEFEAVLQNESDRSVSAQYLMDLTVAFGINPDAVLAEGYYELLSNSCCS
jgi:adenylate cyclase, class 2